jgi:hypothetical protein
MEKEEEKLLNATKRAKRAGPREEERIWSFIKEMASDIYSGGKTVLKDLGLSPEMALAGLALL